MIERRFFRPTRTDDLAKRVLPFAGKWVTVNGWHSNVSMRDKYPDDELVGWVEDCCADIPESELLVGEDR